MLAWMVSAVQKRVATQERELRALNDIAKRKPENLSTRCIIGSHNTGQIKWTQWVCNILVGETGHS